MEYPEIKAIIENILLAADQPVNEGQLQSLLADGTEKSTLKSILEELVDEYYTDLENYSTNWMLLRMIILIIITSTPCIIYREKIKVFIKEQMRDKFINLLGNVYGMERVYHEEGELDELEDYDSVD